MEASETQGHTGKAIQLDTYMNEYANRGWLNGTVLVSHQGEILLHKGYGLANVEFGIPNLPDTPFRIGSLSKAFTAQAVLMLQEQGLLKVSDLAVKYLIDFPHKDITIEHLLAHRSGLDDATFSLEFWQKTQRIFHTGQERLKPKDKPLLFAPGARYQYSNLGYNILAAIIESCSGLEYSGFFSRYLFDPQQMNHTGSDDGRRLIPHSASGYSVFQDQVIRAEYADFSLASGAFSLYSSVEDLHSWYRSLLKQQDYQYAWGRGHVLLQDAEKLFYYLIGDVSGYRSYMASYPEDDLCIIVLSNFSVTPVEHISKQLAKVVFGDQWDIRPLLFPFEANIKLMLEPGGIYCKDRNAIGRWASLTHRPEHEELLGKLGASSSGYIANGRFFELFEEFGIYPSETFFIVPVQNKYVLFKPIRFSWVMLELSLIRVDQNSVEYVTRYYDSKLMLSLDGDDVKAVFTDPQGNKLEAWKRL